MPGRAEKFRQRQLRFQYMRPDTVTAQKEAAFEAIRRLYAEWGARFAALSVVEFRVVMRCASFRVGDVFIRPREAGEGDHPQLAQQAKGGGGGA